MNDQRNKAVSRVGLLAILLIVAALLSTTGSAGRVRPGGHAISLTGGLLPLTIMGIVFYKNWICIRSGPYWSRITIAVLLVGYALLGTLIINDAYAFYGHPYSRARLFGP